MVDTWSNKVRDSGREAPLVVSNHPIYLRPTPYTVSLCVRRYLQLSFRTLVRLLYTFEVVLTLIVAHGNKDSGLVSR